MIYRLEWVMNFLWWTTYLCYLLKKLGFEYQKQDNWILNMETPRTVTWRLDYLRKIEKFWAENYVIIYLDETWFDSHVSLIMIWSDNTAKCSLSARSSEGKRLKYATLEVEKGLNQMLFYCVVTNVQNHQKCECCMNEYQLGLT